MATAAKKPAPSKSAPARTNDEPKETPRAKFLRIAEPRVIKTLTAIRRLGNLTAPSYAFTDDDIAKMFDALNGALQNVEGRFRNRGKKDSTDFAF